jgi:hypothetical protein
VTSADRSQDKLIWPAHDLGQVRTVVMEITDESAAEQVCAGRSRVDQKLISAGTMPNDAIVQYDRSSSRVVTMERT